MSDEGKLLQIAQRLIGEVQLLQMDVTVQRSAYLLLVRRLARGGAGLPSRLAEDLERMGGTQEAPDWQALHASLAGQLRLLRKLEPHPPRARLFQRSLASSMLAPCRRTLSG
jgi:hypothetical protein